MANNTNRKNKSNFIALILIWTAVIIISTSWNIVQIKKNTLKVARLNARNSFNRDVIFRMWNAMHGGLYAPVSGKTIPNPYLSFIPERDITTPSGKKLTLINPAYMTRQLYELSNNLHYNTGHITSLKPVRPANFPDQWEKNALKEFETGKAEVSSIEKNSGTFSMRLMRPLLVTEGCLKCHARQGYKIGDIRGGISVLVPMKPLWENEKNDILQLALGHFILWIFGFIGIVIINKRFKKSEFKRLDILDTLKRSEDRLRQRNEIIENDLNAAYIIQKALMSSEVPKSKRIKIEYRFSPMDTIGGDYFSFTELDKNGIGVFIGDIASHGVTAALYLSLIKATTERIARKFSHSPKQYLKNLNEELLNNMPNSFLATVYAVFTEVNDSAIKLTFSSAGHPAPVLYKFSTKNLGLLRAKGTLLGQFENIDFEENSIILEKGDKIFLYTDGIPETYNINNKIFGYNRMTELIKNADKPSLSDTLDSIIQEIRDYRGDKSAEDDIVIIGIEIK